MGYEQIYNQKPKTKTLTAGIGPVYRCTPSMLVCNDPKQLPVIYHRRADKSNHYSPGGFGKPPGIFNIQTHSEHAVARKLVAQPVVPTPYIIRMIPNGLIAGLAA